ncbi:MAG TPA: type II secretion system F family protein [Chthoniobacter sp.]
MSLSLRKKQDLYHNLGQLVRNGVPFPTALDKLVHATRGETRRLIEAARQSLAQGHTVGESFAAQPEIVTPLEAAVISAVEKSGQLERGLHELSVYFGALNKARGTIIRHSAYPVFVLHVCILIAGVPKQVIQNGSVGGYCRDVGTTLLFVYATAFVVGVGAILLRKIAAENSILDRLLITIPVLGTIRRSFALSRFCTVYGIQLDAGINVIDSVLSGARSSLSGLVRSAVDWAVPRIRSGEQVGPLLAASDAFPTDLTQALIVGEETGSLDDELRRLAEEFRDKAITTLEIFAEWLPKMLYVGVLIYGGWQCINLFQMIYIAPLKSLMQ